MRLKTARLCKCVRMCALGQKGVKCICICMKKNILENGKKVDKEQKKTE